MKYWKIFSIFFFTNLALDIVFNNVTDLYSYRYISKPLVTLSLIIFFYLNSSHKLEKDRMSIVIALLSLLIGDIFLMHYTYNFWVGMACFFLANIFYASVFYRSAHFDIDRSIPYIAIVSLVCLTLLYFVYDKLDNFFLPVTIYMFVTLNMSQAAFLRNKVVNNKSYFTVFIGSLCFLVSQGAVAIIKFHSHFPYEKIVVMFFYGISQYLIVYGILNEKKKFRRF